MTLIEAGRSLGTGLALCRLTPRQLWPLYIGVGGSRTAHELLEYLHDLVAWPAHEHDVAAQAINEVCSDLGFGFPVQYAHEL